MTATLTLCLFSLEGLAGEAPCADRLRIAQLVSELKSESPAIRGEAAQTLGRLGANALPMVPEMVSDLKAKVPNSINTAPEHDAFLQLASALASISTAIAEEASHLSSDQLKVDASYVEQAEAALMTLPAKDAAFDRAVADYRQETRHARTVLQAESNKRLVYGVFEAARTHPFVTLFLSALALAANRRTRSLLSDGSREGRQKWNWSPFDS